MHAVLAALLTAVLAGCGGQSREGSEVDLESIDPGGQEVVFWYQHTLAREELLAAMIRQFSAANPHGIRVRGEYAGRYTDIFNKMLVGIQSGVMPSMAVAYSNQALAYYQNDGVVNLQPYIGSQRWGLSAAELDDFYPSFLAQDRFGGDQVALAPNRSMELLYYNVEWLRELGYAEPPSDYETFAAVCRAAVRQPFSRSLDSTYAMGLLLDPDASRLASLTFSRGGRFMNAAGDAYTLDIPPVRASLQLLQDLAAGGACGLVTEEGQDQNEFSAGQLLFAVASSTGMPYVRDGVAAGARFEWGVAPLPHTTPEPVVNVYGASVVVCRTDPAQQLAAWLFLKWFLEPEQQASWVEVSGYFPARRSTAALLGPYFEGHPQYAKAFAWLPYGQAEPGVQGYERVRRLIAETMLEAVEGAELGPLVADLERRANATLAAY